MKGLDRLLAKASFFQDSPCRFLELEAMLTVAEKVLEGQDSASNIFYGKDSHDRSTAMFLHLAMHLKVSDSNPWNM